MYILTLNQVQRALMHEGFSFSTPLADHEEDNDDRDGTNAAGQLVVLEMWPDGQVGINATDVRGADNLAAVYAALNKLPAESVWLRTPGGSGAYITGKSLPQIEDSLLRKALTIADLEAMDLPDLVEFIPGVLTEGCTLLAGGPKAGKSWLVLNMALARARGGVALGSIPIEQGPVLYLALEDGYRRLRDRIRKLNTEGDMPDDFYAMIEFEEDKLHTTIEAFLARHRDRQPLVIVDTLGKTRRGVGKRSYDKDVEEMSALKSLADAVPGSALVVVHHTRKAEAEDFLDAVSGTQGTAGTADAILVLRRKRVGDKGVLSITGRDVVESEVAIAHDGDWRWHLDGTDMADAARTLQDQAATQGMSDRSAEVLQLVDTKAGTEITPKDVESELGITSKQASVYLTRLADRGQILKPSRGRYISTHPSDVGSVESVETVVIPGQGDKPFQHTTGESVEMPSSVETDDGDAISTHEPISTHQVNTVEIKNSPLTSDYNTPNTYNTECIASECCNCHDPMSDARDIAVGVHAECR